MSLEKVRALMEYLRGAQRWLEMEEGGYPVHPKKQELYMSYITIGHTQAKEWADALEELISGQGEQEKEKPRT